MFSAADGLARGGRSAAQPGFTVLTLFRLDNRRETVLTVSFFLSQARC